MFPGLELEQNRTSTDNLESAILIHLKLTLWPKVIIFRLLILLSNQTLLLENLHVFALNRRIDPGGAPSRPIRVNYYLN